MEIKLTKWMEKVQKMKTKEAVKYLLYQGYNCVNIAAKLDKHVVWIRNVRRQIKKESEETLK